MRIIMTFMALLFVCSHGFSASEISKSFSNSNDFYLPTGNGTEISLTNLSSMKVKDYEIATGKHLNFLNRLAFKAAQKQMKRSEAAGMSAKSLSDPSTGFHLGGFALGFLVPVIGVVITYFIHTDEDIDKNRRKWAWKGFLTFLTLASSLYLAFANRVQVQ